MHDEGTKQVTESVTPSRVPVATNGLSPGYPVEPAAKRDVADTLRPELAGIVSRAVAYVLDAVIVGIVAFGLMAGTQFVVTVVGMDGFGVATASHAVLLTALPALLAAYNVVFWGLTGRTPGMALVGVRVTSTAGRPVSWLSALIRALVLAYFPIVAAWCLVDRRHQGIHDKLARTVVVRASAQILAPATPT
jgi:uncharacterized RDD family membrane protein YckC